MTRVIEIDMEEAEATREARQVWAQHHADRFTVEELTTPPPPARFVLRPYIPEGVPCVLQGAGGTSKTGALVAVAVGIATGRPLFGDVPEPGSTLIVSAEDRRDTLRRHLYAATRDLPLDALPIVARRVVVKDVVGLGFKVTAATMGQCFANYAALQLLVEYARSIPDLRLIALDTLSRTHGGQETNEDLARFVEAMDYICRETGAACVVLHHTGKAQMRGEAIDQYGGRGGSALSDNCRSVLHLSVVTDQSKDAPSNGGELVAGGRLLRLSHVKANLAAKAADVFIERVPNEAAACLRMFAAERAAKDWQGVWPRLAQWLQMQTQIAHPTRADVEAECLGKAGPRAKVREALQAAIARGWLLEVDHPEPRSGRKTYLRLASPAADAWSDSL